MAYSGGSLCYIYQDSIRILDVHSASETEDVVDLKALLAELSEHHPGRGTAIFKAIKSYQNGILTIVVDEPWVQGNYYSHVVIDVRRDFVSPLSRILMISREAHFQRMLITDGRYMVCVFDDLQDEGKFDILGLNKTHWTLKCHDLSNLKSPASIIALGDFLKGHNCVFKLLGGWFYAVCLVRDPSNQSDGARFYYNYCRFPINDCRPADPWKPEDLSIHSPYTPLPARLEAVRLFRGFSKDIVQWQQYDLEQDERTGEVFIIEDRDSGKLQQVILPDRPAYTGNSLNTRISDIVQTIDEYPCSTIKAVYQLPDRQIQTRKRIHMEPGRSFMDVSYDDIMTGQILHLSAGCRFPYSPSHESTRRLPPRGAPQEICEVLKIRQDSKSRRPTICHVDERSLIFDVTQSDHTPYPGDHRIILVNFDSGIHFPGFKPLNLGRLSDKPPYETHETHEMHEPSTNDNQQEEASKSSIATRRNEIPRSHPWFYTEPAKHLEIGKGFQFHRYPPKPTTG